MPIRQIFENVAVSSRIRLARNFKDYPFPGRLLADPHAEEQASEIIRLIKGELTSMEAFDFYSMSEISEEQAEYLKERNLISRDLMAHRRIAAALVSRDESISVMINEEDHVRAQYFTKGFDLRRVFERVSGIDDIISDSIPFAYDDTFGYLTACPTNLGTGLRASVMLFLPACARRGLMAEIGRYCTGQGLTVRGTFGEGSDTEGDLYQISNEITLGLKEEELLSLVEEAVYHVVQIEYRQRERMRDEGGISLRDQVMRSYGILTNCCKIGRKEFTERIADIKLGISLGYFDAPKAKDGEGTDTRIEDLDDLAMALRPANINRIKGARLDEEEQDIYRAECAAEAISGMELFQ